jgi:hypothetical protein
MDVIKHLVKQPYWVLTLIGGMLFVAFPCVTIDKDYHWASHPPNTFYPMGIGIALLLVSFLGFVVTQLKSPIATGDAGGLDLSSVNESDGVLSTTVGGCEIRVIDGRIEDHLGEAGVAIALPCNEYFDDRCVADKHSALGAYVNRVFEGQADAFISLMKEECLKKLGPGMDQQKTDEERAKSFGVGHSVLLIDPLGRSASVAIVSTTTQRAGQGLASRISYLFAGMQELVTRLADARLNKVVMPILGAGHGGIAASLAFVGLLLAITEAARYGQGAQRLKTVTIVVFKRDAKTPAAVDKVVVRRALALVSQN